MPFSLYIYDIPIPGYPVAAARVTCGGGIRWRRVARGHGRVRVLSRKRRGGSGRGSVGIIGRGGSGSGSVGIHRRCHAGVLHRNGLISGRHDYVACRKKRQN